MNIKENAPPDIEDGESLYMVARHKNLYLSGGIWHTRFIWQGRDLRRSTRCPESQIKEAIEIRDARMAALSKTFSTREKFEMGVPPTLAPWIDRLEEFVGHSELGYVYFLCNDTCVYYVGQTINISDRLQTHRVSGLLGDSARIFYMRVPREQMTVVERYFIGRFRPSRNLMVFSKIDLPDWLMRDEFGNA
jgi:hypothetical protein